MRSLATFVLVLHFLWILAVLLPVPLIIWGGFRGAAFVKNPWFRYTHASMMALVLVLAIVQIECPLTSLEKYFLAVAGDVPYAGEFIETWVRKIIFFDIPSTIFLLIYVFFFALIVALLFIFPPRK